jgi:alkylated DNA repair dioxygenase AlkB
MNTLFDIGPVYPPGFYYFDDFISEAEEKYMLELVSSYELGNMKFHEYEAKRKVASFGYGWSFTEQKLVKERDIPTEFNFLEEKLSAMADLANQPIQQFLITEYPKGSVINWHRDAPPYKSIAGISLLADCIFKLRPYKKEKQNRSSTVALTVKRRSLYLMTGISRTEWEHCTSPVKQTRLSLTFRTLNNK